MVSKRTIGLETREVKDDGTEMRKEGILGAL